jgi:lipoyl(octanoyl) transferase
MTGSNDDRLLHVHDLGLVDYDEAWAFQRAAAHARIAGKRGPSTTGTTEGTERTENTESTESEESTENSPRLEHDLLILCQHPPVVTLGRSTKAANLLATPAYLESVGVQLRDVERGGDITVHEPGQLVAYPIFDLERHRQDLHWYLRQVEEVVIRTLSAFQLDAGRREGLTGVWCEGRKLASIGVHARDWVTWHGVAVNVENDLSTFSHVVPCGIDDVQMTTVARECGLRGREAPSFVELSRVLADTVASLFDLQRTDRALPLLSQAPVPEAAAE